MRSSRAAAALALAMLLGVAAGRILGEAAAASLNFSSQALTPYRTCTITATPSTTSAVADASVRQSSPALNFGTSTTNNVASGTGVNRRLYIRFDLTVCSPAIPATAVVRLATVRLYATAIPAVCRTVDLFPATAAWTEAGLTWNNQPFGTAINNPASGTASDTYTIGTPAGCGNTTTGTYISGVVVTSDVARFVAGTATNNGWMLRDDVEGSATTYTSTYSAKDLGTIAQVPQLVVTYVVVP